MMKAGTETGSLTNHLYSRMTNCPTPEVGGGATILCWTDRHAATITRVTRTQIHVQQDIATRTDQNGMSENQSYVYSPDPTAPIQIFRKTQRDGWRNPSGEVLLVGCKEEYHDYSF